MTFGWEGFQFDHPEDWYPTVLSGSRREGYVRIASPGKIIFQVRWRQLRQPADSDRFLDAYLGKLERDSRKSGSAFQSSRQPEAEGTTYSYSGSTSGRGLLFKSLEGDRAFVLEAASTSGDGLRSALRKARETFRTDANTDRWSVLGLDISLPSGLEVERREFLAGKTRLILKGARVQINAERWGFADQLIVKHGLEAWAGAILGVDGAKMTYEDLGLRAKWNGPIWGPATEALVRHQTSLNQLVVVRSTSRDPRWRPTWDWLN